MSCCYIWLGVKKKEATNLIPVVTFTFGAGFVVGENVVVVDPVVAVIFVVENVVVVGDAVVVTKSTNENINCHWYFEVLNNT